MKLLIVSDSLKMNFKESVLSNTLMYILNQRNIEYTFDKEDNEFDGILLVNWDSLTVVKNIKQTKNIPVILICYKSDMAAFYTIDLEMINHVVIIRDTDIDLQIPYPSITTEIPVPFVFSPAAKQMTKQYDICVCIGSKLFEPNVLFKMLRCLNQLSAYKILINTTIDLQNIVNSHIIVNDNLSEINTRIQQCKLVIGSGYPIMYAIENDIPAIIVGERGYGGILAKEHLSLQYSAFFQGRIGGKYDSPIPEHLLYEDVISIMQSNIILDSVKNPMNVLLNINSNNLVKLITKLVDMFININRGFTDLKFNNDFIINAKQGRYWLINRFTRQIVAELDEFYYKKILEYKNKTQHVNEEDVDILKQLLENAILI